MSASSPSEWSAERLTTAASRGVGSRDPVVASASDLAVAVDLVLLHRGVTAADARDLLQAHAERSGLCLDELASDVIDRGASILPR